ncbi:hypothetical protein AQUCO_02600187v1 [Aquilegia coerulea]|uniref:DYW domain-containing protein n=1 Tax=Aquilegia coerulea TaxID=218851 RepID=A0A2G5D7U9_AQUCA|nr:hypothetical protein AQUCO_02600187v1 [Aquilegia coerulea]
MNFSFLSRFNSISSSSTNVALVANSVKTLAFFLIKNNNFSITNKDDFNNATLGNQQNPNTHPHNNNNKNQVYGAGFSRPSYHHHSDSTLQQNTPPPNKSSATGADEQQQFQINSIYPHQFHQNPGSFEETISRYRQLNIWALDDFCKRNKVENAVQVLEKLENMGVHLDLSRCLRLMQACADFGEVEYAKKVHHHLIKSSTKTTTTTTPIQLDVSTFNQILYMYSECGSMSDAWEVFETMSQRDLMSWDTMIAGFAKNYLGEEALNLFTQFKEAGLKPNGQIFMGVFLACSVLCDIDEGMLHFESMTKVYGIVPSMEHYVSVVNMLGSIGYLDEAVEFIEKMPFKPSIDVWEALMNLCRYHGNNKLGDHCAEMVKYLDPSRLTDDESVKAFAKDRKKFDRLTFYNFMTGEMADCPQKDELFDFLRRMISQMKEFGYAPCTSRVWTIDVLLPIEEEEKEECLFYHREKVNVALSLMYTLPRTTIRVMVKPSRICEDCHDALKFISKLAGRVIIITNHMGMVTPWIHEFDQGWRV